MHFGSDSLKGPAKNYGGKTPFHCLRAFACFHLTPVSFAGLLLLACCAFNNMQAAVPTVIAWGQNVPGQSAILPQLTNVVAIAPGLALKRDGSLLAWGDNRYGQTNIPPGLTNVAAISAGVDYDVVLTSNGTVVAWGDNLTAETNVPASLSNVQAISAADFVTLALKKDGTVAAWGSDNGWGSLAVPPGLSNVIAICSGGDYALALKRDGTVVGWGADYDGQIDIPAGLTNVIAIAQGLALKQDGTVVAWGDGQFTPTNVPPGLSNVQAIAVGPFFCLALQRNGTVVSWGNDIFGDTDIPAGLTNVTAIAAGGEYQSLAIGDGSPAIVIQPTNQTVYTGTAASFNIRAAGVAPLTYRLQFNGADVAESVDGPPSLADIQLTNAGPYDLVVSNAYGSVRSSNFTLTVLNSAPLITKQPVSQTVLPGWNPTLTIQTAGSLPATYQWRLNGVNIPGATAPLLALTNVQMSQGGTYSIAVSNAFGALLSSNAVLTVTPSFVLEWQNGSLFAPSGVTNVVAFAAGLDFGLAAKTDGTVVAWGDNTYGETSVPTFRSNDISFPVLTNVIAVAAGAAHSLALKRDGAVLAWGAGSQNADYPPDFGQSQVPPGLSNVIAIAAGGYFTLALKADGTVAGWGDNRFGQADPPPWLSNAVAIAAGSFFAIALRSDGTVVAWGNNNVGQTNPPAGLGNVVAIAAGAQYGLALKSDGSIVPWGRGSVNPITIPPGLGNIIGIAASTDESLALKPDGTVFAWGILNTVDAQFEPSALWPAASNVVAIAAAGNISLGLISRRLQTAEALHPVLAQGAFSLFLPTESGRVYQMQFKDLLDAPQWTSLPLVPGNGQLQTLLDTNPPTTQRFYRVLRW